MRQHPSDYSVGIIRVLASILPVGAFLLLGTMRAEVRPELEGRVKQSSAENSLDDLLRQASSFLTDGQLEKAEADVRTYLANHPASAEAHFLLGQILFRKIQADAFERQRPSEARERAPEFGMTKFQKETAQASLGEYTEGAKYARPSASDLKIVALDYVLLGSYGDASKWLERSVEENPKDPEAWYYLGRSKYNENRFEEAIRAFSRCLEIEPQNVKAQSNLGLSYAGLNRIPDAMAAFQKAIEWQANAPHKNAEPYIDAGDLLMQQNRMADAVTYLLQAVQIAPGESRAREKLGSAYLNLNDLGAAQNQLESAVALDPENPSLHYLLGSVYRRQGRAEKAKAEFERFQALKDATGTVRP